MKFLNRQMNIIKSDYLIITYTNKPYTDYVKNLSGHLFELFDYYFILSKHYPTKILIPENTTLDYIKTIISTRYIQEISDNDIIISTDYLVKAPVILNTDDCHYHLQLNRKKFITNKFFAFACGDSYFEPKNLKDIITLADSSIYKGFDFIDYKKKVYPGIKQKQNPDDTAFLHLTKSCKKISSELLGTLIQNFKHLTIYTDYLNPGDFSIYKNVKILKNFGIFDFNFTKFIYTPVSRQFDCSPRLIIECCILGVPVIFYGIHYRDRGLFERIKVFYDFENYKELKVNDNELQKFLLKDDDDIVKILNI